MFRGRGRLGAPAFTNKCPLGQTASRLEPWKCLAMAERKLSPSTDASIWVDTSRAPWMEVARRQIGTKEFRTSPSFLRLFYMAAVQLDLPLASKGKDADLLKGVVTSQLDREKAAATTAASANAVSKYLATVKTDPARTGKAYTLPVIGHEDPRELAKKRETAEWESTPWCAAFVNWCLLEAGSPYLGYATAASWLRFGTPLASPVPGCVTIMPPGSGGISGHVAFLVKKTAKGVVLLGGNQGPGKKGEPDEVNEKRFNIEPEGYRWPTSFNHVLTSSNPMA